MRIRASFALLLATTSCTTTYSIPKAELSQLDGWMGQEPSAQGAVGAPGERERKDVPHLRDSQGRAHPFTEDTPLVLFQSDGEVVAEKYIELNVDSERFRGVPQAAFRRTIEIPWSEVKSAGVREFSLGKTVLLSTSIALGLTASFFALKQAIGEFPARPSNRPPSCGDPGCAF